MTISSSVLRIVARGFPSVMYGYPRTYVVTNARSDGTCDLAPPPDAPELPELDAVEQWGLGSTVSPPTGALCLVVFRDANPSRPAIVAWQQDQGSETLTSPLDVTGRVVKYGDFIVFPSGSAATPTGLPVTSASIPGPSPPPVPVSVSRIKG